MGLRQSHRQLGVSNGSDLDWLSALASEASEHSEWREFSAFADRRSRGLRTDAFRHLGHFIRAANDWEFEERLGFCRWLLRKAGVFGDLGIASPQPGVCTVCVHVLAKPNHGSGAFLNRHTLSVAIQRSRPDVLKV